MILVDGVAQAEIDATDRGLHYGDGLFETLAVLEARIRHWPQHLERLQSGCRRLGLDCPPPALLEQEIRQLSDGHARRVVKIIVTRGGGPRGYRPPQPARSRRILLADAWPEHPASWAREGVRVRLCQTRLGHNPSLAGLKHCNRLEQVLARQEWNDEAEEGLMQDERGHVIEGTMSNLFLVRDGALATPDLSGCGVAGVVRRIILDEAPRRGIPAAIEDMGLEQVRQADGLLLCNSLIGIWPVCAFEGRRYPVPALLDVLRGIEGLEAA